VQELVLRGRREPTRIMKLIGERETDH
jgi:hypothetical protein